MGNPAAPNAKQNQMLSQQYGNAGKRETQQSQMAEAEYAQRTGLRDQLTDSFWNLYNQAGEGGGGGGGSFNPAQVRPNEAMAGYREFSNTGGWSPEQIANAQSISTGAGKGIFQGLGNAIRRAGAGSGISAAGLGGLARQGAYEANDSNARALMGINENIRSNRLSGLSGLGQYDTELMNREDQARREANAASAYGAGAGARSRSEQAGYLSDLMRLQGNDLPYWNNQSNAAGQATQVAGMITPQDNRNWWQRGLGYTSPIYAMENGGPADDVWASIAQGAMGGGGGKR